MGEVKLPTGLPDIGTAKLPAVYESAVTALAECSRIDECLSWGDKAEALASYARQARDDQMRKMADRIQARAIRRCGELLKQIERADTAHRFGQEGTLPPVTRTQAATEAGLSEHRRKQALRVANVPEADFNAAVESDDPPTVTKLAEEGKKRRVLDFGDTDPKHFAAATKAIGHLRTLALFAEESDMEAIVAGIQGNEREKVRQYITTIDAWLDQIITRV